MFTTPVLVPQYLFYLNVLNSSAFIVHNDFLPTYIHLDMSMFYNQLELFFLTCYLAEFFSNLSSY